MPDPAQSHFLGTICCTEPLGGDLPCAASQHSCVCHTLCEQGFSMMKRVKSDLRSSLATVQLQRLMAVATKGLHPDHFNAGLAVHCWYSLGPCVKDQVSTRTTTASINNWMMKSTRSRDPWHEMCLRQANAFNGRCTTVLPKQLICS